MGNGKNISISVLKKNALKSLKGNWGLAVLANLLGGIILSIPNGINGARSYETMKELRVYLESIENGYDSYSKLHSYSGGGLSFLLNILITGAVVYGLTRFNLNLIREKDPKVEDIFEGFKRYGRTVLINLLLLIFKGLWSLLLIIPIVISVAVLIAIYVSGGEVSAGLGIFILIAAIAGSIALQIFLYRYSMAYFIFNDNDELDAMGALKESIELMDGYKVKYFLLHLSFIGWGILSILTIGIGLLFLIPYIRASESSFYQQISIGDNPLEVIEF
ncbi:MAG: DUF975 family protein [Clostridiaceae bacterium]